MNPNEQARARDIAAQLAFETEARITTTAFCAVKADGVYFNHDAIRMAILTAIEDGIYHYVKTSAPTPDAGEDGELLAWLESYIATRSEELAVELHAEVMAGNVVKEYAARSALAELSALRSARVGKQGGNKS